MWIWKGYPQVKMQKPIFANKQRLMEFHGLLSKMDTELGDTVQYYLNLGKDLVYINPLIGKDIRIQYKHKITCMCGKEFDKVFRQNMCFDCFQTRPEAGEAIFFPEKSKAHLGIEDRNLEFEKRYQLQPHVVYLANSGGLKVGVTRKKARLQRWIDQGAVEAIVLAETSNRFEAGQLEVYLKQHLADKTDWRAMLCEGDVDIDLKAEKNRVRSLLTDELQKFVTTDYDGARITYPVEKYPQKVLSTTFKKTDEVSGELSGVRGQYLIFNDGRVFNVRSHEGHQVSFSF
jgi:hypothetical protein